MSLQPYGNLSFLEYNYSGDGTPEDVVKAPIGSVYIDVTGGARYVKTTGYGFDTGWVLIGRVVNIVAAGTVYTLTNTAAAIDFGTTDPVVVIPAKGRWLINAQARLQNNGATYASSRTVTVKLRRTNNTAADLTGGTNTFATGVTTTVTGILGEVNIAVIYDTSNTDDSITLFADVSTVASAGDSTVTHAAIQAQFLGPAV